VRECKDKELFRISAEISFHSNRKQNKTKQNKTKQNMKPLGILVQLFEEQWLMKAKSQRKWQ